ncbi:SGNH/GDSL hydrolase family protein [Burkholderia dolosa]|uniref:SGNH/GDSL hydrolase family protein n=1 Tax=Burkholderia dolosa TaxID=152500 RepID=UPI0015928441|nr:SGNH/GDSL hydrolase family protein [Burkholderia dolosa]MBR8057779.1 SGNH/GDSL hydrolase family protein [Burkholderia dolosa]MBR8300890.1 SGNH/GDSL hydrolase family protein [Burkholderia dolosa]MBR8314799.1 SGNH/GDSL hydrolase family protein [Burkholderia dolosa]MBR8457797.1 SGNH/GDSL hydrolase family protein [Burkholderia dolosa]MBY4750501.1 acylhydrolase [Burkholderia dolosa]
MQSQQPFPTRARQRLLRTAQVAIAGAALALLAACGGGDDNNSASNTPPSGVKMQVVSFGDSLSDVGTYSQIKLGFGGGRFTTNPGQVWTQNVAQYYGDTLQPANQGGFGIPLQPTGGLGYAQGGSRVTLQPGIGHADASVPNADYAQATTTPIADQVKQYLSQHGSFNANQIVLINGGANDIFYQAQVAQAQGNTPAAQLAAAQAIGLAAQQLAGLVQQIVAAGATHVFVANVPDIGGTPLALQGGTQAAFTQLSGLFNQTLAGTLAALKVDMTKVVVIDAFKWQDGIAANYQANGFSVSNTDTACNLKAMVAAATQYGVANASAFGSSLFCSPQTYTVANADQTYMFADTVHPTTRLHALFAQYVEQQIAASGVGK